MSSSNPEPYPNQYETHLIARLEVKQGDVVVLTVPRSMDDRRRSRACDNLAARLPLGVRIVVLSEDMSISVLDSSQVDEAKYDSLPSSRYQPKEAK